MARIIYLILFILCTVAGFGQQLSLLEYWFDSDFNSRQTITLSGEEQQAQISLQSNSLTDGFHQVYMRVRNSDGTYSPVTKSDFVTYNNSNSIRYWFNDQMEQQKELAVTDKKKDVIQYKHTISTGAINNNMHKLYFQLADGPVYSQTVSKGLRLPITENEDENLRLIGYKYWFDEDIANSYYQDFDTYEAEQYLDTEINTLRLPSQDRHAFQIQFLRSDNQWSDIVREPFDIYDNYISLYKPLVVLSNTKLKAGDQLIIKGRNYTANGKIAIMLSHGVEEALSDTILADTNGNMEYIIPITGDLAIHADYYFYTNDITTDYDSYVQQYKVISEENIIPSNQLAILYPYHEGLIVNSGEQIDVKWTDYISIDNRYAFYPSEAKREYNYQIELFQNVGEKPIVSVQNCQGKELINNKAYFACKVEVPSGKTGQFFVRIFDKTSNHYVDSKSFTIVTQEPSVKITKEWDYSVKAADGSYHRMKDLPPIGVAADGTARVYLTVTPTSKSIQKIKVELQDNNGVANTTRLLGKIMKANDVNKYSKEANDIQTLEATHNTPALNKYYFWYVAPDDFNRNDNVDDQATSRFINAIFNITFADNTTEQQTHQIEIVRPAVMLVHGLGGSANGWEDFSINGTVPLIHDFRYKLVHAADVYSDGAFVKNARGLLGYSPKYATSTFSYVNRRMRYLGYASNRMDYICHSMGGCILRYAIEEFPDDFFATDTYEKGFVNKTITINTPHEGSPLGDALGTVLDLWYSNKYAKLADLAMPYISDMNDMYNTFRDCSIGSFKFFDFIKPYEAKQHTLQGVANWGEAMFGGNWRMKSIQHFKRAPAVVDLSINDGVRFKKPSPIKAHMIAGDVIPGFDGQLSYDLFKSKDFDNLFKGSKVVSAFFKIVADGADIINSARKEDVFDFMIEDKFDDFIKTMDKIELETSWHVKLIGKFDNMIKYVNTGIALVNTVSFVFDSDFVVPVNSQLTSSWQNFNNHTTVNGFKAIHLFVLDHKQTASSVEELMNSSIQSNKWNVIPGTAPSFRANNLRSSDIEDPIEIKNTSVELKSEKIKICYPETNVSVKPNDLLTVRVKVSESENLEYIELGFQGEYYKQIAGDNKDYVFNLPVKSDFMGQQRLMAKACYESKDNLVFAFDGALIQVSSNDTPIGFNCTRSVIYCGVSDTIRPGFEVVYPEFITHFGISDQLMASINNDEIIAFEPTDCSFITKKQGTTFVELEYMGLKDTIFFIVEPDIENYKTNPEATVFSVQFIVDDIPYGTVQVVEEGDVVLKPVPDPEKEGFIFLGWYQGEQLWDFNAVVTNDLVLSAKWEVIPVNNEMTQMSKLSIYPNPFKEKIHLIGVAGSLLHIINLSGNVVHIQELVNNEEIIYLNQLPTGTYFFRFEKDGKNRTIKGIKNK